MPYLIVFLLIIILLTIFLTYLILHRRGKLNSSLLGETVFYETAGLKMLATIRKRLETHLEMLQEIRHTRILTKTERSIKTDIEDDLDTIDKAIEKQKSM